MEDYILSADVELGGGGGGGGGGGVATDALLGRGLRRRRRGRP